MSAPQTEAVQWGAHDKLALNAVAADGSGSLDIGYGKAAENVSSALGTGAFSLYAGTLAAGASNINEAAGSLTVTGGGTSYLDFGAGGSNVVCNFANSSMNTWNGTLDILNDPSGNVVSIAGLTSAQLSDIYFVNPGDLTGTFPATETNGHLGLAASTAPEPTALSLLLPALSPLLLPRIQRRLQAPRA